MCVKGRVFYICESPVTLNLSKSSSSERYSSSCSGAPCLLISLSIWEALILLSAMRSTLCENRGQVSQYHLAVPQNLAVRGLSTHNRILCFHMSILKELNADRVSNPFQWKFKVRKMHHLHSLFHMNYTLWMTHKLPLRQWLRIIKGAERCSEMSKFRPGSVF